MENGLFKRKSVNSYVIRDYDICGGWPIKIWKMADKERQVNTHASDMRERMCNEIETSNRLKWSYMTFGSSELFQFYGTGWFPLQYSPLQWKNMKKMQSAFNYFCESNNITLMQTISKCSRFEKVDQLAFGIYFHWCCQCSWKTHGKRPSWS